MASRSVLIGFFCLPSLLSSCGSLEHPVPLIHPSHVQLAVLTRLQARLSREAGREEAAWLWCGADNHFEVRLSVLSPDDIIHRVT